MLCQANLSGLVIAKVLLVTCLQLAALLCPARAQNPAGPDLQIDRSLIDTFEIGRVSGRVDAARKLQAETQAALAPFVEILDPDPAETIQVSKTPLAITYRVRSSIAPVRVSLYLDGDRVLPDGGLQPIVHNEREYIDRLTLNLPQNDVLVWVVAENASGSSRAQLHVRWVGDTNEPMPNLYVLAVGIKEYKDSAIQGDRPIQFADRDAIDFAKVMKAQEGKLYTKVEAQVLPNSAGNRTAILQGLLWLKANATNKDVAMVFFSGHGVSRDGAGYDYLPFEADKLSPELTYLHDFELKDYIRRISAKIVAFIDTCHSGYIFQQPGAKAPNAGPYLRSFAVDLAKSSVFTAIYTSSTGEELSWENEHWGGGHGAFTLAILEGFNGAAGNTRGGISLARLNDYIAERVKELTGGKQHPMFIAPYGTTNPVIGAGR